MNLATATDSLRCLLTGANAANAVQRNHCVSLGGWPSCSEANGLGVDVVREMSGIQIDFASPLNPEGLGALTAISTGSFAWTPCGGTQGVAVAIANGETKIIPGEAEEQYIRVTRTSADDLSGSASLDLHVCPNTVAAGADEVKPLSEVMVRCMILKNVSAYDINNLIVWVEGGAEHQFRVASDTPDADGRITDTSVNGETYVPVGNNDWNWGQTPGTGLAVGTLAAGEIVGIWIRKNSFVQDASPKVLSEIHWQYDLMGHTCESLVAGTYCCAETSIEALLVFRGVDDDIDFATPFATVALDALPAALGTITADATYKYAVCWRNAWGLISAPTETFTFDLDDDGEEIPQAPSAPTNLSLTPQPDGSLVVRGQYERGLDPEAQKATHWAVCVRFGSNPEPGAADAIEIPIDDTATFSQLEQDLGPYGAGEDVRVLVTLRTYSNETTYSESTNTAILQATVTIDGESLDAPDRSCCWLTGPQTVDADVLWRYDSDTYIDLVPESGVVRFYIDGVLVAAISSNLDLSLKGTLTTDAELSLLPQHDLVVFDTVHNAIIIGLGYGPDHPCAFMIDSAGNGYVREYSALATLPAYGSDHEPGIDYTSGATTIAADRERVVMVIEERTDGGCLRVRDIKEGVAL